MPVSNKQIVVASCKESFRLLLGEAAEEIALGILTPKLPFPGLLRWPSRLEERLLCKAIAIMWIEGEHKVVTKVVKPHGSLL